MCMAASTKSHASAKRTKKGDDGSNFHGQVRKNDTHQSTSDPEAKLYRKADGREAKLCYMGHALMENRNGLAVGGTVTQANGTAERRASEAMLKNKAKGSKRITVGEDKAYDAIFSKLLALHRPRRAPARRCFAPHRGFRLLACARRVERRSHGIVDALEPHETHLLTRRLRHVLEVLAVARGEQHGGDAGAGRR